jgi:hypothetical protein
VRANPLEPLDYVALNEAVRWMRTQGVSSLEAGSLKLTLGSEPTEATHIPQTPRSAEEIALDRRRKAYRKEFGFTPADSLLARLP